MRPIHAGTARSSAGNPHSGTLQNASTCLVHAYLEVRRLGHDPKPEVMIPLVATQRELLYLRETLEDEIAKTFVGTGQKVDIPIGTMIETPRAAITASRLGVHADFFSLAQTI